MKHKNYAATKWFPPYGEEIRKGVKKQTYSLSGVKGVYLIKKDGRIAYIGKSHSDVKSTLYRHFQEWTDMRSSYTRRAEPYQRVTFKGVPGVYQCKVITCPASDIDLLEMVLISRLKPAYNSLKLELFTRQQENRIENNLNELEEAPF